MMFSRLLARFPWTAVASLLAVGCGGVADSPFGTGPDALPPAEGELLAETVVDPVLLPGDQLELWVRYQGATSAAGTSVEFAVVAPETPDDGRFEDESAEARVPAGASLEPATAILDANGAAKTTLTVGSTPGNFQVRALLPGIKPAFFDIRVGEPRSPTLSVWVEYSGLRSIASRSATVMRGLSCDEAKLADTSAAEVHTVVNAADPMTFTLEPKLSYAIVAWGRDDTGAEQAIGCAQHTAILTADPERAVSSFVVKLEDRPLRVMGVYELELLLDLTASMERVRAATRAQVQGALPSGSFPEASAYVEAVRASLVAQSKDASQLNNADVTSSLAAALAQKGAGLLAAGDALAALLSDVGRQITLSGSYGVGALNVPMSLGIESVIARSQDGGFVFDLAGPAGEMAPSASILAEYEDARAQLDVNKLGIALGLGSYARALLDAIARADTNWPVTRLTRPAGCDVFTTWSTQHASVQSGGTPLCDAVCASQVCSQVLNQMVSGVRSAYLSLDSAHPAISLAGLLSVHNRDTDDLIEDLGPSDLSGNWGKAQGSDKEDAVTATLLTPMTEGLPAL